MKLEKRSAGAPAQEPASQEQAPSGGNKKPVIVYIMILFIVAFLLMALSFAMHQRSNSVDMDELKDKVDALQATQATQGENIQLQNDLKVAYEEKAQLQKNVESLEEQLAKSQEETESAKKQYGAMNAFYTLQQQYAAEDDAACQETIAAMEKDGLDKLLPAETTTEGIESPAQLYLEIREDTAVQ